MSLLTYHGKRILHAGYAPLPPQPSTSAFVGWAADAFIPAYFADATIVKVTNLNSTGIGSLRDALNSTGKRVVVLEKGGVIDLAGNSIVMASGQGDVYIAGETGPYPGIFIVGGYILMDAGCNKVILSHVRILTGLTSSETSGDSLTMRGNDIIIDHCSLYWAGDENISTTRYQTGTAWDGANEAEWRSNMPRRITVSNSIIAESTYTLIEDGKGMVIFDNSTEIALYKNLFISQRVRNPLFKQGGWGACINNYIQNPGLWGIHVAYLSGEWGSNPIARGYLTLVGNYQQAGPNTTDGTAIFKTFEGRFDVFMSDNINKRVNGANAPQTNTLNPECILVGSAPDQSWHSSFSGLAIPASTLQANIVANVGAWPANRWSYDQAKVNEVLLEGSGGAHMPWTNRPAYPTFSETSQVFNPSHWDFTVLPFEYIGP